VEGSFEKDEKEGGQPGQSQSKLAKSKEVMEKVMVSDYASRQVQHFSQAIAIRRSRRGCHSWRKALR